MEPTSLIYLPDGTVLDPVAVAAIHPADDRYVYYRLLGTPGPLSIETKTPEHAAELRAYMVACKELATSAVVVNVDTVLGDWALDRWDRWAMSVLGLGGVVRDHGRKPMREAISARLAQPTDWLDPQSRRALEHREAQGPDGIAAFCAEVDGDDYEPSLEEVHLGLCHDCYAYVVEMGFAPKGGDA